MCSLSSLVKNQKMNDHFEYPPFLLFKMGKQEGYKINGDFHVMGRLENWGNEQQKVKDNQ